MPKLRFWRFVLSFAVLYGVLILPWPGLQYAIGAYVQAFGSRVFGQSGREFLAAVKQNPGGPAANPIHHLVLFRPKGAVDKGYSAATDTVVVLYNFDIVDKDNAGGSKIGLESKNYFWLPFAFYLALVGATPIPWRRRLWALFVGFLAANALLALTLGVYLADHASDISMIVLPPFWKWAAGALTRLLLVVSGPSTFIYLLVWPFACFRREDIARLIPGGTPKPAAADRPIHRNSKARTKAARRRQRR